MHTNLPLTQIDSIRVKRKQVGASALYAQFELVKESHSCDLGYLHDYEHSIITVGSW